MSDVKITIKDAFNNNKVDKEITGVLTKVAKNIIYQQMADFLYEKVWDKVPRESNPRVNPSTGTSKELISNARVTVTKDEATAYEVVVHFGSDDVSKMYAFKQHDDVDFEHDIGQYKFLQDPFMEMYPLLLKKLKREIGKSL